MIFEVKDGCFGYNNNILFKNVSFKLNQGDVLSILGANGVGKTTLLRCMMGLLKWNNGYSKMDDTVIDKSVSNDIWKKIGYVPQAKNGISPLKAKDLVLLGRSSHLKVLSQPTKKDKIMALEALEKINMGHLANSYCSKMSGGELQMVLIARALCINPKLLILDEPESNLDFSNQLMVLDTISNLAKNEGISAIMNTHYPAHAMHLSNKSLLLKKTGENIYGKTNEVITEKNLEEIFNVNVKILENNICGQKYNSIIPIKVI